MNTSQSMPYTASKDIISQFYDQHPQGVVVIWGATATGKTGLSVRLADDFPIEVVSSDSRQIFRHMDIATDKISQDIRNRIPHHQINIIDPNQTYTAGQRQHDSEIIIDDIISKGNKPFVVGGTGLYIDTIYKNFSMPDVPADRNLRSQREAEEQAQPGLLHSRLMTIDPDEAHKHPPQNTRFIIRALEIYEKTQQTKTSWMAPRPPRRPLLMLGLRREKDDTNRLINQRIKQMFDEGLVAETQRLLDQGYDPSLQSMQGIGYKETIPYLQGAYSLERAEELIRRNTHRLAKKQRTRFRRYRADSHAPRTDTISYHVIELS